MDDRSKSSSTPSGNDVQERPTIDAKVEVGRSVLSSIIGVLNNYYIELPKNAWIIIAIFPVITVVHLWLRPDIMFATWRNYDPPKDFCSIPMDKLINIAIADFSPDNDNIGRHLLSQLEKSLYEDTGIDPKKVELRSVLFISSDTEVQDLIKCTNANIFIWNRTITDGEGDDLTKEVFPELIIIEPQEGSDKVIKLDTFWLDAASNHQKSVRLDQYTKTNIVFITGLIKLFSDHYTEAAHHFNEAILLVDGYLKDSREKDELLAVLYFYKGRSLAGARDADGAKEAYEICLSLNPNYTWAYIGIGNLYFGQAQASSQDKAMLDQALIEYEHVLNIHKLPPGGVPPREAFIPAKAHINIGNVYTIYAEVAQDLQNKEQAIQQAQDHFVAALGIYNDAQQHNIHVPERYIARVHYGMGVLYELREDWLRAQQEFAACVGQAQQPIAAGLWTLCTDRLALVSPTP